MSDQDRLRARFDARIDRVTATPGPDPTSTVFVLLRELDLTGLATGARRLAAELTAEQADRWLRSWTRARFLFGNPVNLDPRWPARVVADGGSCAWFGPLDGVTPPGRLRLFKPVTGFLPALPAALDLPPVTRTARSGPRELAVATADLTLAQYLVHLHHTLVEATLLGLLAPTEPIRLTHHPELVASDSDDGYARVHYRDGTAGPLRLYADLTPRENRGEPMTQRTMTGGR